MYVSTVCMHVQDICMYVLHVLYNMHDIHSHSSKGPPVGRSYTHDNPPPCSSHSNQGVSTFNYLTVCIEVWHPGHHRGCCSSTCWRPTTCIHCSRNNNNNNNTAVCRRHTWPLSAPASVVTSSAEDLLWKAAPILGHFFWQSCCYYSSTAAWFTREGRIKGFESSRDSNFTHSLSYKRDLNTDKIFIRISHQPVQPLHLGTWLCGGQ